MPARTAIPRSMALLSLAKAAQVDDITDLPQYNSLAACASDAVANVIETHTKEGWCDGGATALQACICATSFSAVSSSFRESISKDCGDAQLSYQSSAATLLEKYCQQDATTITTTSTSTGHPLPSYVQEIDAFSYLAPCAQSGLKSAMGNITLYNCPTARSDLASCVCENGEISGAMNSIVKTDVESDCDDNSADVTSAWEVFAGYCSPSSARPSMPTITNPPGDMTYYMMDMEEYKDLRYCAQGAMDGAMYMLSSLCPTNGPQALASCVCIKDKIYDRVSSKVTRNVRGLCASSITEEQISSATDVVDLYCSAARGETSLSAATETGAAESDNSDGNVTHESPEMRTIIGAIVGTVMGLVVLGGGYVWVKQGGSAKESDTRAYSLPEPTAQASRERGNTPPVETEREDAPPPPYEAGTFGEDFARNGGTNATTR